jgi:cell division septal protein FtsQ
MASLADLKRVDVSSPEVLTVTTGQGAEITLGLADLERQLRRWRQIYDRGQKENKLIATLDLAVTNNIPVCWLEASTLPPAAAKLPKPLRTRKKHV